MTRKARKPLQGGRGDALHRSNVLLRAVSGVQHHVHTPTLRAKLTSLSGLPAVLAIGWRRRTVSLVASSLVAFAALGAVAHAQTADSQVTTATPAPGFGTPGTGLLPNTNIDRSQPLYLQGDELIYDNSGNSVTARGNVEIFYNNYILTADEVTYDQSANTLTAVGNVVLKEPN
ncbi:MAG: hypothetical protein AAFR75_11440, partial [Pseudomonadota bacterium]